MGMQDTLHHTEEILFLLCQEFLKSLITDEFCEPLHSWSRYHNVLHGFLNVKSACAPQGAGPAQVLSSSAAGPSVMFCVSAPGRDRLCQDLAEGPSERAWGVPASFSPRWEAFGIRILQQ